MKATIIIPRGWHRVTRGKIREGDRKLNLFRLRWEDAAGWAARMPVCICAFLIRKK